MEIGDTSLGGTHRSFPATTMGILGRLGGISGGDLGAAVEILGRRYWKPVYHFIRLKWSRSNEDAKDLTQAFFAWLMAGDALRNYALERGSFRGYLKVLLDRFVGHEQEALGRLKRGGGIRIVTLDAPEFPLPDLLDDSRASTPEQAFDRSWLDELVKRAVDRVRRRLEALGRGHQFRVFEEYDLSPSEEGKVSYAAVAARLGMKESDVRNHLFAAREAVRAEIRAEILEMTTDERSFEEEWNALFGG